MTKITLPAKTLTLRQACVLAGNDEAWAAMEAAKNLGDYPLAKGYADPEGDRASFGNGEPIAEMPYRDPMAAEAYFAGAAAERELIGAALNWLELHHWRPTAREEGTLNEVLVPYYWLNRRYLSVDAENLLVEGTAFVDLRFVAPGANTIEELINLVSEIAARFDPEIHVRNDFKIEVKMITGKSWPTATILQAMKSANVNEAFFRPGRRTGS